MDIYLTKKSNKDKLRIPLLPDRVSVKTGAMMVAFQVIKLGEVRIPRGNTLTTYSWSGVFPGRSISEASFIHDWQEPDKIIAWIKKCKEDGETLTLMVTGTTINDDVFIENFTFEHYGIDNVSYTISLTHRPELYVTTVPAPVVPPKVEETTEEKKKQYGTVKTSGSNLNIRKKPTTDSSIIGKLKNGTKVEILGKTGNWYIIPYSSGTDGKGYICATYVKLDGSGGSSGGSSSKKSGSGSTKKKTTSSSSTSSTTSKKTLTVKKPGTTLTQAAKSAVKTKVSKVAAYSKTKPYVTKM